MNNEEAVAAKRRRGRPPGSGIDDSKDLRAVADLLLAEPKLKPTTAMKRVVYGIGDNQLRRLQDKWKVGKDCLLAEARERAREHARQAEARRKAAEQAHLLSLAPSPSLAAGALLPGSATLTLAMMVLPPDSALGIAMEMTKLIQNLPETHPLRIADTIAKLSRRLDPLSALRPVLDLERRLNALDPFRHLWR